MTTSQLITPAQRARIERIEVSRCQPGTRVGCPQCEEGTLHVTDDGLGDRCDTCAYDSALCDRCGTRMSFDSATRGLTCGGHMLVGWRICPACPDAEHQICHLSQPADAVEWTLAKGGRSLTAGGLKIRAESSGQADVEAVMARIVRVPELEARVPILEAQVAALEARLRARTQR